MSRRSARVSSTTAVPQRFDELEAYRGIAALCIVIFHAYQYSLQSLHSSALPHAGALHTLFSGLRMSGVFFVLSGFLLFLPFARAALAQQRPRSVRSFLVRRLIRILPLYYFTLVVVWAWRFTGRPDQLLDLLLHLSFTHTFHASSIFWTIGPAWSLAVEVQFYLLLAGFGPLVYGLCGRLSRPRQRQALIGGLVGALFVASALFKWWAFTHPGIGPTSWPAYHNLPARLDALALGMLLALMAAGRREGPLFGATAALLLRLAGLALIVAAPALGSLSPAAQLYHATLVSAAATLLVASTALGPRGSGWERALRLPPLQFLGAISYGIYLLHEPLMLELGRAGLLISPERAALPGNVAILIVLSVVAATLGHYLLERPCNELRYLFDHDGRVVERYAGPEPLYAQRRPAAARQVRLAGDPEHEARGGQGPGVSHLTPPRHSRAG